VELQIYYDTSKPFKFEVYAWNVLAGVLGIFPITIDFVHRETAAVIL